MQELNFLTSIHTSTRRDYIARVNESNKGECALIAKQWGYDYWDGNRQYGYGGYRYDGRWRKVAEEMAAHYQLKPGDKVLDIGCGKGFLLYELTQVVPGLKVVGTDVSEYGLEHAKEELKPYLKLANATSLPFEDNEFDFVYSMNVFHNLYNYELMAALKEMQRVAKKNKYICIESYRNEFEKANFLYWQLTCETFYSPDEWLWFYNQAGYEGDYGFIYFE